MLEKIQNALNLFSKGDLTENALNLFQTLGYESERQLPFDDKSFADFAAYVTEESKFSEKNALAGEWQYVDLLFQLTESELTEQNSLFAADKTIDRRIVSYLFFVIELPDAKNDGHEFSRTDLSNITREVNKVFEIPAMILFKCGSLLTLSVIDREPHKRDESKDVLKKITLIKDINFREPHRAHLEILEDLALPELQSKFTISDFLDLHNAWQKVLDTKELNKRFFKELANWYFWAVDNVSFPESNKDETEDVRNATSVIRLITRLMFVWFLKEKGLVSDKLFDENYLKKVIKFKDDSAFYKAILQNLFFATLNSNMGERKFIAESYNGKNNQHFVHNVFRYKQEFITPEETIKELFDEIPFLNGGLFECLDKEAGGKRVRVDGFSDSAKNVLQVPDELFFGAERDIDLSEIYDDKKKAKSKVRGLINLLDNYKFTITENTPIEEEIALDPELLGKVFENLLANYNPETKTTARKQTGSFYTPREIVNFMVDESLIAYLKAKLQTETQGFRGFVAFGENQPTMFGNEARKQLAFEMPISNNRWHGKDKELETALRDLFSYSEDAHRFNETETEILIKAIDNCKILDPACGSGAFPMGVLLKLVHILEKLDKDNAKWREWQRLKAEEDLKRATKIEDKQERANRLIEINDIFDLNSSDYGRKLFLIENCVYGVDIQPVAIQIAKLRFFISLIVDQKTNPEKENLGIRPLPNLETKFVSANTLIGLETNGGLKPNGVADLEKQLKEVRAKHFGARNRKSKEKYREEDKNIRNKIAELLKQGGINETSADLITDWNPYDQNASAKWFDAEWMFGIEKGFDIVIGNPPYVQLQKIKDEADKFQKVGYATFARTGDIYCIFYELGNRILAPNGILTYITSNKWMRAAYGQALRKYFSDNTNPLILIDFGGLQVFDAATVDTNILILQKAKNKNETLTCVINKQLNNLSLLSDYFRQFATKTSNLNSNSSWVVLSSVEERIKSKIEQMGKPLKDWNIKIYRGILTGCNEAFVINETTKDQLIALSPKNAEIIRPILRGRNIKKFCAELDDNWIINSHNGMKKSNIKRIDVKKDYPQIYEHLEAYKDKLETRLDKGSHWTNLRNCAYLEDLDKEKIVWIELTDSPNFYLDNKGYFINNTVCFMVGERLPYILSFLNSRLCEWYFTKIAATSGAGTRRWFKVYVEQICIPQTVDVKTENKLAELVSETQIRKKNKLNTKNIEQEIDQEIFKLFALTNEEISFILNSST